MFPGRRGILAWCRRCDFVRNGTEATVDLKNAIHKLDNQKASHTRRECPHASPRFANERSFHKCDILAVRRVKWRQTGVQRSYVHEVYELTETRTGIPRIEEKSFRVLANRCLPHQK